jgi:hypothetical protein
LVGSPDAPMQVDEILAKFRRCLDFGLNAKGADADGYTNRLLDIEKIANVSDLIRDFPEMA